MIVVVWHILSSDHGTYQDLGPDYFERRNDAAARQRYLVRELERLGNRVTVEAAA
jgi:transposase